MKIVKKYFIELLILFENDFCKYKTENCYFIEKKQLSVKLVRISGEPT